VVYAQIYDEAERAAAETLLPQLRDLGVATPGIENVTASAASHGRTLPFQWHVPTVLYSDAGTQCASAISAWMGATRPFDSPRAPGRAVPALHPRRTERDRAVDSRHGETLTAP